MTGQRRQTTLASSICRRAGPVLPIGKNSSGSSSRQAARWRQSMRVHSSSRSPLGKQLVNVFTSGAARQQTDRRSPLAGKSSAAYPAAPTLERLSSTLANEVRVSQGLRRPFSSAWCRLGHKSLVPQVAQITAFDLGRRVGGLVGRVRHHAGPSAGRRPAVRAWSRSSRWWRRRASAWSAWLSFFLVELVVASPHERRPGASMAALLTLLGRARPARGRPRAPAGPALGPRPCPGHPAPGAAGRRSGWSRAGGGTSGCR